LESRGSLHDAAVLRRLIPLLAVALGAGESLVIEAPGASTSLGEGGIVTVAGRGFVARRSDWLLTGDALRWDQRGDSLWASGGIVLVTPAVRLHAERIGLRPEARTGDAWGVQAWVERGKVRLRVTAERVELRPDRLTFHGVRADFGHGGVLALQCPRLHLYLREEERPDRGEREIDRWVEGIAAVRPSVWVAGAPVLWLPYLYRDYILDYPWSKVEVGKTDRLGWFLRYSVGSNLPELAGWRTRLEARADRHTRAGNGFGLAAYWSHQRAGRGGASVYRMVRERVADPADESQQGGVREVNSWDAEHYLSGAGWAAAARSSVLPDADPSATLAAGRSPDERFRADFQQKALEEKPFARQGLSAAWISRWASFSAEGERRANAALDETERLLAAEIGLARLTVAGPLAVEGHLRSERLRQEVRDNEAVRTSYLGRLAAVRWVGGLAFDASLGLRGVGWSDGRLAGAELPASRSLAVPFADAGMRLRLVADREDGGRFTLAPRLGVELLARERGTGNPGFDFRDGIDDPDQDRRYLVTGLESDLRIGAAVFTADLRARWGLRPIDLEAREVDGSLRASSSSLADATFAVRGSPHPDVEAVADGTWDARLARWTSFDTRARWRVLDRLDLLYGGTFTPPSAVIASSWVNRLGSALRLSRYRLDGWVEVRPDPDGAAGGRSLDLWHLGVGRELVDGSLTIAYDNAVDSFSGGPIDHRFFVTFVVGGGEDERNAPARRAFGF
jgi:hypothetical protein